jgi:hypothetical protein
MKQSREYDAFSVALKKVLQVSKTDLNRVLADEKAATALSLLGFC